MFSATFRALLYAAIFHFPLTEKELWERMICPTQTEKKVWQEKLKVWVSQGKIIKKKGYYFLPGGEGNLYRRKREEKNWPAKFVLAQKTACLLAKIPSVYFVGLTGSLAVGVAKPAGDIDLMIITAPGTLWLTRFFIYLLLKISRQPVRRPGEKFVRDKLCLNLFLDSNCLSLDKDLQNLFIAHEIVLLKPLYDKNDIYQKFLSGNRWVGKYLPHAFKLRKKRFSKFRANFFLKFLNRFCFWLQKLNMYGKPRAKRISLTSAFFHPRDRTEKVLEKFLLTSRRFAPRILSELSGN